MLDTQTGKASKEEIEEFRNILSDIEKKMICCKTIQQIKNKICNKWFEI